MRDMSSIAATDRAVVMRRRARALVAVLWLALAGLPVAQAVAAPAPTIALVTDVVGNARLAARSSQPLKLLAELGAGAEVVVAENAQLVVFYLADGAEYTFNGPGRYRLRKLAPEALRGAPPLRKASPTVYRTLRVKNERVAQGALATRGDPILIFPVSEVVLDGNAEFAWRRLAPDAAYQFELVDASGTRLMFAETRDTGIRLPPTMRLTPGETYYWSVRGRDELGNAFYRPAEFRIADAALRNRLEAAAPAADASFSERVLYAALLEQAGCVSAAQAQKRILGIERPVGWAERR
jgi:hypothetical protein